MHPAASLDAFVSSLCSSLNVLSLVLFLWLSHTYIRSLLTGKMRFSELGFAALACSGSARALSNTSTPLNSTSIAPNATGNANLMTTTYIRDGVHITVYVT